MKPLITPARSHAKLNAGLFDELIVDNFAGAGGASMGIEAAIGRSVDVAINHDAHSVRMHQINHPFCNGGQRTKLGTPLSEVTGAMLDRLADEWRGL